MSLHAFPSATASPWRFHFTRCSAFSIRHGHPSNPFLSIQSDIRQENIRPACSNPRGDRYRDEGLALFCSLVFRNSTNINYLRTTMSGNTGGRGVQRLKQRDHANDASFYMHPPTPPIFDQDILPACPARERKEHRDERTRSSAQRFPFHSWRAIFRAVGSLRPRAASTRAVHRKNLRQRRASTRDREIGCP